jgi:integrase/recombinase XerC
MPYQSFIDYLSFEKRASAHTITAYKKDLEQFFQYLKTHYQITSPQEVEHTFVRSWIAFLMEQKISAKAINRKLSALRSFYTYLNKQGIVQKNPLSKIIAPKIPKRLPAFVPKSAMDKLFEDNMFADNYIGNRDKLIMEMFYQTGIRVSELVNLKISDIDFSNNSIKVLGKRNKERIVPISQSLISTINTHIANIETEFSDELNYLFLTEKAKKIYVRLVYNIVNTYLSRVATITQKSPHVLRHTFATHMLENGADINAIKELLGHSSLSATQVYTHNTIEKLKNVYDKAHPRG